jgi:hypothetical protein
MPPGFPCVQSITTARCISAIRSSLIRTIIPRPNTGRGRRSRSEASRDVLPVGRIASHRGLGRSEAKRTEGRHGSENLAGSRALNGHRLAPGQAARQDNVMDMRMTKLMRPVLQMAGLFLTLINTSQADDQTFRQASIGFIKTYFQHWSSSNAVALTYLGDVFPDRVTYFNKTLDHTALMNAKHRFMERWPERRFKERGDSLNVTCDEQHLCTVWGLVDWECRSQARHESATGTSAFSFQLQDGMAMVAEDGFVLSRGQILSRHPPGAVDASSNAMAGSLAAQGAARASLNGRARDFTDDDIPGLRAAYFAQSSDRDWIKDWLLVQKEFTGTARSLGPVGVQTLSGANGDDMHVIQFDTHQGPIACVTTGNVPSIAQGSDVRIHGIVSIFIDQTMYLANCSFT